MSVIFYMNANSVEVSLGVLLILYYIKEVTARNSSLHLFAVFPR